MRVPVNSDSCLCRCRSYGNWRSHRVAMGYSLSNGEGRTLGTVEEGLIPTKGQEGQPCPPLIFPSPPSPNTYKALLTFGAISALTRALNVQETTISGL
jgi:hypothetical protein